MSNTFEAPGAGRPEMRTSTHRRLSVTSTEQLLDGSPGTTPLHVLLAAATRPGSPEELSGAPDVADPVEAEDGSPASAGADADTTAEDVAVDDTTGPTPSPSLHGLCNAYSAGAAEDPEKLARNPAFGALVTAAGGPTQVAGFCAGLEDTGGKQATAEDPAVDDASGEPEETAETAHGNSDGHEPPAGAGKEKVRR